MKQILSTLWEWGIKIDFIMLQVIWLFKSLIHHKTIIVMQKLEGTKPTPNSQISFFL